MRTSSCVITTDALGAGTAVSIAPISGEICQVHAGAVFGAGILNVSRAVDGFTFWNGVVGGSVFNFPRPVVDGYLICKVSGGGASKTDTVRILWEDE